MVPLLRVIAETDSPIKSTEMRDKEAYYCRLNDHQGARHSAPFEANHD
jgi:hypothetical protein